MAGVGPQLPPHLAKRKRDDDDEEQSNRPHDQRRSVSPAESTDAGAKKRRVMGPAPPPAPLDERPLQSPNQHSEDESSSVDDDDFGPSLPDANGGADRNVDGREEKYGYEEQEPEKQSTKRDEWMTVPPKKDDLAARMDPTQIRARGFNTGKGGQGPAQSRNGVDTAWTETPEQKRKRLANQVMGISEDASEPKAQPVDLRKKAEHEEKARKIKQYNEKHRSKSLYTQHQGSDKKQKEDDPSARGFDYEKDMGGGMKIGHSQRKELMKKASDFGSKFSSGSYL